MTNDEFELSRRKVLAAVGTVGAASAGAGVGTSALFSDTESIEDNSLTAGELDLKVDWEEHYYDGSGSGSTGDSVPSLRQVDGPGDVGTGEIGFPDPTDPIIAVDASDLDAFMTGTRTETGGPTDDPPDGIVELKDVKPGDFGEVTLSYHLTGNPGYVRLEAERIANDENGLTEPEEGVDNSGGDPGPGNGELGDKAKAVLWYDPDCDNVLDEGMRNKNVLAEGSLNEVLDAFGASGATPPTLDPTLSGGRIADGYSGNCHGTINTSASPPFDCSEKLYLTDTKDDPNQDPSGNEPFGSPSDDTTTLYEVTITGGNAEMEKLIDLTGIVDNDGDGVGDYNHVVSIAASPDGKTIYLIDKFTKRLGSYDVANDTFTDHGEITGAPDASLQAAVSPAGKLYFTVFGESNLYVIDDPDSSTSVDETIQLTDQNGDPIVVGGSDIAFLSNGTLYLFDGNTPPGTNPVLYKLSDPSTGDAERIGELPDDVGLPGLAVRAAGDGNLIGANSQETADELYEIDLNNLPSGGSGQLTDAGTYPLKLDGSDFDHQFGDMTVGSLCPEHCVALAWWIPRDVGNEIQSDSITFDLTFRTEQCRHNTTPFDGTP